MSAGGVKAAQSESHWTGGGATPTPALQQIMVSPIPHGIAKEIIERYHYLHSLPGGTQLAFGVLVNSRLMGALTIGCGSSQAYRLVEGAEPEDCGVLTRLWLSDELPRNSESKVIGIVLRALGTHTHLKFLISYADPSQGHLGTIYQATNWLYTGLSAAMPLYDLGDGVARHSRSLSHAFGTHSLRHFAKHDIEVKLVPQASKHRYMYFLDGSIRSRLDVPVLPYPKSLENSDEIS